MKIKDEILVITFEHFDSQLFLISSRQVQVGESKIG